MDKKRIKLKNLNDEVSAVKDKLMAYKDHEIYKQKSDHLRQTLEKEDNDQKNKKKKKYNRDLADYSNKTVFKWQTLIGNSTGDTEIANHHPFPLQPPPPSFDGDVRPPPLVDSNRGRPHNISSPRAYQRGQSISKPKTFRNNEGPMTYRNPPQSTPQRSQHRKPPFRGYSQGTFPHKRNPSTDYPRQGSRDSRGDPRDYYQNSYGNRATYANSPSISQDYYYPQERQIPLQNRFAPLSQYSDPYFEDNPVISRHPNQFTGPSRNDYQDTPQDSPHNYTEAHQTRRFFPQGKYKTKRGYDEREASEGGGGSGPKKRKQ